MSEPLKLLYVDDEPLMRRALARALKRQPVTVLTASSGKEALAIASQETLDIVITDYMLEDITGLEVASKIHALQPEAQLVMVSGNFDWTRREAELEAAGIEYFLSKPWESAQLESIIRELIKRKRRT